LDTHIKPKNKNKKTFKTINQLFFANTTRARIKEANEDLKTYIKRRGSENSIPVQFTGIPVEFTGR
jgi:hypothetical protein